MKPRMLVPLDGTSVSESIIPTALALAHATKSQVHFGYVVPPPSERTYERDAVKWSEATTYLNKWMEYAETQGVQTRGTPLHGDPASKIIEYAVNHDIGLVTMATHGKGAIGRIIRGSVTDEVIRQSPVPVLTRRESGTEEAPQEIRLQEILVPLDGSEQGERALPPVVEMAKALGAKLHLLQVVRLGTSSEFEPFLTSARFNDIMSMESSQEALSAAQHYLDHVRSKYIRQDLEIETQVQFGQPVETIQAVAKTIGVDLIAMSTHGRSGVWRLIMGSVTTEILARSPIPVLTVSVQAGPDAVEKDDVAIGFGRR